MNLTIRLQQISRRDLPGTFSSFQIDRPLLICNRCHDIEEVVIAIMEIPSLEETWALCGACVGELPAGFMPA
jgi:hypothetical protein